MGQALRCAGEDRRARGVGWQEVIAGSLSVCAGQYLCIPLGLACVHACLRQWRLPECAVGHWRYIGIRYLHCKTPFLVRHLGAMDLDTA